MIKITPFNVNTKAAYNQAMEHLLEHSNRDYKILQKTLNEPQKTQQAPKIVSNFAEGLKNFFEQGMMKF